MGDQRTTFPTGNILIVDDTPASLHALSELLARKGHLVRAVTSGAHAVLAARAKPPDLILLDIMMPEMDGYEVCEHLKADECTRGIPVIFISALNTTDDKVKGFAVGGVDFVVKPFHPEEVYARVETHLALRAMHQRLEEKERDSERRFRTLFESAPLCIFEVDLTRTPPTITQANYRTGQVYGWPLEELSSASVDQIVPPDAMPEVARIVDALQAGEPITVESVNQRRDGSLFPVRINAAPATKFDLSKVILVVEDITLEENRRSEEEAIAAERRRIAREIHDGLAQNLAALRFRTRYWHNLVDRDPGQMHAELDELREILSDSITEVRRSIFALRPVDLDKRGLFPALHRFATSFGEHYRMRVNLDILGPRVRLPESLELTLFRVVQEALNNVGKHAQASAVRITVDLETADTICVTIQDDGKGFDPDRLDQAVQYGHLGLRQMRERVECADGALSIHSQPGSGTEIRVTLPLREARSVKRNV
jgi:PAS domain S-box-containing protein